MVPEIQTTENNLSQGMFCPLEPSLSPCKLRLGDGGGHLWNQGMHKEVNVGGCQRKSSSYRCSLILLERRQSSWDSREILRLGPLNFPF